jgi:uncharacterized protein (TIGR00297 family)
MLIRLLLGLVLSALIAAVAYFRKSLSGVGALAAVGVGTAVFFGGGQWWFAALFVFFVTSSALGRVGARRKEGVKRDYQKGDTRDAMQVFANGGVAAICALSVMLAPSPWLGGAFLGALATATGDTWATELGVLSRREPVSLLGFRRVPAGTSGAVSGLGLLATLLGGLAIGVVGFLAPSAFGLPGWVALTVGAASGVVGSLVDSLAGATVQASFHCPACDRACEAPVHHCGTKAEHRRGPLWFDNDTVNLLATLCGALLGGGLEFLLDPVLQSG